MKGARLKQLAELDELRQVLHARRSASEVAPDSHHASHAAAEQAKQAFAEAVGPVLPLASTGRRHHRAPLPDPVPRQRELDEAAALRATWSDAVDVESLLLTDDGLGFQRPGLPPDVLARLRRGQWSIQGQIDLHGMRRDEARDALAGFLDQARKRGWRCLRVVHGKGLGSPGREPVLKAKVQRWLAQSASVMAFAQASAPQGGAGALIVLLVGGSR